MTASEIHGYAEGLANVAERFNQPVPQPQPVNRFDMDLPDDEFLTGRQVKGIMQQLANQGPPVDETARGLAAQGLYSNIRNGRADEFKRWGSEIDNEIRKLPVAYWTYDALNTIVNMVRANHVDELVAEKAQRLANESHPTIRSGTGGSGSGFPQTQSVFETASPAMLANMQQVGITDERSLREACAGTGVSPEQFVAELSKAPKGPVIHG